MRMRRRFLDVDCHWVPPSPTTIPSFRVPNAMRSGTSSPWSRSVLGHLPLLVDAWRDHDPSDPVSVVPTTIAMWHSSFGISPHPSHSLVDTIHLCSVNSIVQSSHQSSSWSCSWEDWHVRCCCSPYHSFGWVVVSIVPLDWDFEYGRMDSYRLDALSRH